MGSIPNVNVNQASFGSHVNINDNVNTRIIRTKRAQRIAGDLERKFGGDARKCHNFFLKCAWRCSENTIWSAVEASHGKTSPIKYFISIMKAQPEMC